MPAAAAVRVNDGGATPPTNDGGETPPANDGGGWPSLKPFSVRIFVRISFGSWIACEKCNIGRAWIYIDGAFVEEVNIKRLEPIEGFQRTVFRADGLTNGPHTLAVEPVGGGTIVVDAFDVHPLR